MDSEHLSIHTYGGTTKELVEEMRALFSENPDNDFIKLRLATILFLDGQFRQSTEIAAQVAPAGSYKTGLSDATDRVSAQRELASAARRARAVVEEEARQIPGEGAFELTMEQWDAMLQVFDRDVGF